MRMERSRAAREELNALLDELVRVERGGGRLDGALLARALHAILHQQLRILDAMGEAELEPPAAARRQPAPEGRAAGREGVSGDAAGWAAAGRKALEAAGQSGEAEPSGRLGSPLPGAVVPEPLRRQALASFPLPELNRWLAAGTVFQIRGAFAYLNLRAMGGDLALFRHSIRNMGFREELGLLAGAGIEGEVELFRRP